ncbi:SpvB-domain-containing protein [Cadophora sp. DSE1049]|nr:SpvB-domain-containing protein [Cadophora sp. DSE1049]
MWTARAPVKPPSHAQNCVPQEDSQLRFWQSSMGWYKPSHAEHPPAPDWFPGGTNLHMLNIHLHLDGFLLTRAANRLEANIFDGSLYGQDEGATHLGSCLFMAFSPPYQSSQNSTQRDELDGNIRSYEQAAGTQGNRAGSGASPDVLGNLPKLSSIPSAPSISLPKGGGAISSMGEKFDVDQVTGSGSVSIPIEVSPGRPGMQPQLSLNYNSGSGNSEFGLGWAMRGYHSITRKTSKGLPRYDDRRQSSDANSVVFLLSATEDLVPVFKISSSGDVVFDASRKPVIDETAHGDWMIRRYVPRVMQTFSRIERWSSLGDHNDMHWRVLTPENHTIILGRDNNSRIFDPESDQSHPSRILSWLQCEEYDPFGNAIVHVYKSENSESVPVTAAHEAARTDVTRRANRYLKTIKYGNVMPNRHGSTWITFSALQLPPATWKFSVVLDYGEHDQDLPTPAESTPWACRTDPFSRYHAGFEIRTYRICKRVLMFHHFSELNSASLLVSSLDLVYQQSAGLAYLVSVSKVGYSLDAQSRPLKRTMPPVEFGYRQFAWDNFTVDHLGETSLQNLPAGIDQTNCRLIDLDGEGLPGLLMECNGAWYYKRNTSANNFSPEVNDRNADSNSARVSARFGALETLRAVPSISLSGSTSTHLADVDGSGKLSLIETAPWAWGFFERDTDEPTGWAPYHAFEKFPNIDVTSKGFKLIDLTGDGLLDVLLCDDQVITWSESRGVEGFGALETSSQPVSGNKGPVCLFSDTEHTLYLADMSGDGLSDIVRIQNSDVCYWPNCGYGKFGKMIRMDHAPGFDRGDVFNNKHIRLTDIDGSGTTDIVYISPAGIDVYLNLAGNSFASRRRIPAMFPIDDTVFVDTADLLGNGTKCIVWSSGAPPFASQPLRYIDLNKGKKPHLLNRMDNNLGAEKRIHFVSSTKFYLDDLQSGNPWISTLSFPVHCVESVEVFDRISHSLFVQRFKYHHGYFDGVEREFRGFARTDVWDSEVFATQNGASTVVIDGEWHTPPIRTTVWFHTGNFVGGNTWSQHLANEYYHGSSATSQNGLSGALLPDSRPPEEELATDALQESYRALKGHLLRKEVYCEDGSGKASVPYLIEEQNYVVKAVQPIQDSNRHSVFSVFPRESVTCHVERDMSDPRLEHEFALDVDRYGNVKKSLKVLYGRLPGKSQLRPSDREKQETPQFLYYETETTTVVNTQDHYRTPKHYEVRSYQVSGFLQALPTSLFQFEDFAGQAGDFQPLNTLTVIPFEAQNEPSLRQKRLVHNSRALFRSDDLSGLLPPGQMGPLAIPGVNYELAFTPSQLSKVYVREGIALIPNPTSLLGGGIDETRLGYVDIDGDGSWWKPSGRAFFSTSLGASSADELAAARSSFYQPQSFSDVFGNITTLTYDDSKLLPILIVDAVGNKVAAEIDYRVMKHRLATDPNGNQTAIAFDAFGMVSGMAQMGKSGSNGDSLDSFKADLTNSELADFFREPTSVTISSLLGNATTRTIYNHDRYKNNELPVFIASISRVNHVNQPSLITTVETHVEISYSDGFGRVTQSKRRVKPGSLTDGEATVPNRWITSGWTVNNNKGKPVRQYEPFFDDTHDFKFDMKVGNASITVYDGLSRVVATLFPDHTMTKMVTTAWSSSMYDANDNVLTFNVSVDPDIGPLLHDLPANEYMPSWYDARISGQKGPAGRSAAQKAAAHSNTPRTTHNDSLGRVILQIDDAGGGTLLKQRITYDILGQIRQSHDARGRLVELSDYTVCGDLIYRGSMEGKEEWTLPDATGKTAIFWNTRGFRSRSVFDPTRRPTELWVMERNSTEVLVEKTTYGENAAEAEIHNLRGNVYQSQDQSGEMSFDDYDLKGNISSSRRRFAIRYKDTLDWSLAVELEEDVYTSTATFDALNRQVSLTSPDSTTEFRLYNESGHVEKVHVNVRGEQPSQDPSLWLVMVRKVEHDARDQLVYIDYGNGVSTTKTYDPLSYRIQRIRTVGPAGILQDLTYTFDASGNIVQVEDQAQQTIFFRNARIDPSTEYTYDSVYRLIQATGREHLGQTNGQPNGPTAPGPFSGTIRDSPTDGNALARYTETYKYDGTGNLLSVAHALNGTSPGWKRMYNYSAPSLLEPSKTNNRLSSTSLGSTSENYTFDAHGNTTSMPHLKIMRWDFRDQLQATSKQMVSDGIPETTYYVYDHTGKRVRKVTESQAGGASGLDSPRRIKDRVYLGAFEIFRTFNPAEEAPTLKRVTTAIECESDTVTRIHTRIQGEDSGPERAVRFELANHLSSVCLVLDERALLVSYEEYFPFGGISFASTTNQNDVPKRYRFCGKEKDDETGLYYYGARYQAPWLGRWLSMDPGGTEDGLNLYEFVHNSPITINDPDGRAIQVAAPVAGLVILGFFVVTAIVATPQKAKEDTARLISHAMDSAGEGVRARVETAKEHISKLAGEVEDWIVGKPIPMPPDTLPIPPAPAPPTTAPPTTTAPPIAPNPPTPAPPTTKPTTAKPRAAPRARDHLRDKIKDRIKDIEKEEPRYKNMKWEQHHIYPQQFFWFFDVLGIDIDAAHNLVLMPSMVHNALHTKLEENAQWSYALHQILDLDEFDQSQGASLKGGINPQTGMPYNRWGINPMTGKRFGSVFEVRAFVEMIGASRRAFLNGMGFPTSPVPYVGWGRKNRKVPQNRFGF